MTCVFLCAADVHFMFTHYILQSGSVIASVTQLNEYMSSPGLDLIINVKVAALISAGFFYQLMERHFRTPVKGTEHSDCKSINRGQVFYFLRIASGL